MGTGYGLSKRTFGVIAKHIELCAIGVGFTGCHRLAFAVDAAFFFRAGILFAANRFGNFNTCAFDALFGCVFARFGVTAFRIGGFIDALTIDALL